MKILFVTTYDVVWRHEHFFTRAVSLQLARHCANLGHEFIMLTLTSGDVNNEVLEDERIEDISYRYYSLANNNSYQAKLEGTKKAFQQILPDVIHSNMVEGFDIEAARDLGLPIFTTIHIGGFICPRGGGEGFLRYNDSICRQPVGSDCARCMCQNLPFPSVSYLLHKLTPRSIKKHVASRLKRRIFYLTPFLRLVTEPEDKIRFRDLANYTHIIAANKSLVDLLEMNGIQGRVHLLPHGVKDRRRLPLPSLEENDPVKFYFLGRAQYAKGLHIIIEALQGIDPRLYELYVIGDDSFLGKESQEYYQRIKHKSKKMNVHFVGHLYNSEIDTIIKDCHVMIHSAIFHEVYGIAIAESLSMGRPVLATRCGGAEMQVKDGINGWLINPNDVEDMRKAILHIISHKNEIKQYADNATNPMSLPNYVTELLNLYETNR